MTIVAYRITRRAFAAAMWTGAGARDHGGRWNSKGVAAVYTAESRSLAAVEQLVHLVPPRVLTGYVIASVTFDARGLARVEPGRLPKHWNAPVAPASLRTIGDEWITAGRHVALAVPSAVVPGEWNYLLNPAHRDFEALAKSNPAAFALDARLR